MTWCTLAYYKQNFKLLQSLAKGYSITGANPLTFLPRAAENFFGYDQKVVRDSNFVVEDSKSVKKLPKLQKYVA